MKKNELERTLQKIPPQSKPKPGLEQYSTPAWIAADILYIAYAQGNIADKKVVDLGCGNGIFSIGSWLLGARSVLGIDIDPDAIEDARRNAAAAGADIELLTADVTSLTEKFDTAIMNPPFGSQRRGADRPFLVSAMRSASKVYSLHMADTLPFLSAYITSLGGRIELQKNYKFEIPHMFGFHEKTKKDFEVVLIYIRSLDVNK